MSTVPLKRELREYTELFLGREGEALILGKPSSLLSPAGRSLDAVSFTDQEIPGDHSGSSFRFPSGRYHHWTDLQPIKTTKSKVGLYSGSHLNN